MAFSVSPWSLPAVKKTRIFLNSCDRTLSRSRSSPNSFFSRAYPGPAGLCTAVIRGSHNAGHRLRIVLVQQQITIVIPVGKVIDHHQFANMRAQMPFPFDTEAIMIHHQPIRFLSAKCFYGLRGIFGLRYTQPGSVILTILCIASRWGRQRRYWNSLLLKQGDQVATCSRQMKCVCTPRSRRASAVSGNA